MPVWLSCVLLLLINRPVTFGTFLDDGQFAIYGAAAAAPLLYLLFRDNRGREHMAYFVLILLCLLLTVAIVSGLVVVDAVDHLSIGKIDVNHTLLRWLSVGIYLFALLAMFFMTLHENVYKCRRYLGGPTTTARHVGGTI